MTGTPPICCFNTQPPEGGWRISLCTIYNYSSFNTQPPEGGWPLSLDFVSLMSRFNTQPPEGGWYQAVRAYYTDKVSTHSRLKAAGPLSCVGQPEFWVSTHSRLKAAG